MSEAVHPVDLHVGRRLRECRAARSVTQAELAAGLGVSAQQVQKYENGSNRISASKLFEIAGRLGTEIDWFFDGIETAPAASFAEPAAAYEAEPGIHDQTRALIAAFKALPDDAARADAIAYVRGQMQTGT